MTAPHKSQATKKPKKRKLSPEAQARAKERKAATRAKAAAVKKAKAEERKAKERERKAEAKAKAKERADKKKAAAAKRAHAEEVSKAYHEKNRLGEHRKTLEGERNYQVAKTAHKLMKDAHARGEYMSHPAATQKARGKHPLAEVREEIAQQEDSNEFKKLLTVAREIDKQPPMDRAHKADELIATLRGRNFEIMQNVVLGSPKGSYVDEVKQSYKGAGHHRRHHGHRHHRRHHGHGHHHHGHHGHGHHGHGHHGHGHP